ncbi:unnamed protein product [Rangifer tarandus platyrhynchus]|uniref:Uncharacterized protein n=1 Tax=Rangifer tarandus platyrhynchus TaxID=3082113 RepID=A0ABN8XZW5_RANTA|nr:unnamed protein product [Rangifer tarandus platyrhynchus]
MGSPETLGESGGLHQLLGAPRCRVRVAVGVLRRRRLEWHRQRASTWSPGAIRLQPLVLLTALSSGILTGSVYRVLTKRL